MKSASFFKRSKIIMLASLFFVGLQAPIFMQAMGAVTTANVAQQLRNAKDTLLSALKSRKAAAIQAAVLTLIALLVVVAAKKSKFLPGAKVQASEEAAGLSPDQIEFVNLLDNFNGDPLRLIELLKLFTSQKGGLTTSGIEKIGNSAIAQNPENKEVLQNFFLNSNIEEIYASKEAANTANRIFGETYSF